MLGWMLGALSAFAAGAGGADILTYPLGAGDEVRIDVVGEPDMSGTFRVAGDGTVTIPYAGAVKVEDLTVDQATIAVTKLLGSTVLARPQVILTVEAFKARQVEVAGAVKTPGVYPLQSDRTTVKDALVRSGGLQDLSSPRAQIHRQVAGQQQVIEVDLERIYRGDLVADLELRPGDHLYIPPAESVFIDGQVQKPGAIAYRDGMTLTQAIAQAGSTLGTARQSAVYILRGNEKVPVNYKRILRGEEADVSLRPSDRVYVPESAF